MSAGVTAAVLPVVVQQFFANDGTPLAGGKLYSYQHGASTLTNQALYTDVLLTVPYANPLVLNSAGRPLGPVWPLPSPAYDFVLTDANDVTVWSATNIVAVLGAD